MSICRAPAYVTRFDESKPNAYVHLRPGTTKENQRAYPTHGLGKYVSVSRVGNPTHICICAPLMVAAHPIPTYGFILLSEVLMPLVFLTPIYQVLSAGSVHPPKSGRYWLRIPKLGFRSWLYVYDLMWHEAAVVYVIKHKQVLISLVASA